MEIKFYISIIFLFFLSSCSRDITTNYITINSGLKNLSNLIDSNNWTDYQGSTCTELSDQQLEIPKASNLLFQFDELLMTSPKQRDIAHLKLVYCNFEKLYKSNIGEIFKTCENSDLHDCTMIFFYFEELLKAWDDELITIKSKKKIERKYIECIDCVTFLDNDSKSLQNCKFIGYEDIEENVNKCFNSYFSYHSAYYAEIITKTSSVNEFLWLSSPFTRFEMHSDIVSNLAFGAFLDQYEKGNRNDWKNCVYHFQYSKQAFLDNIFRTKYLLYYQQEKVIPIAFNMLEKYGGGKFPLFYLSTLEDENINHKVFEYFFEFDSYVRMDFYVFLDYFLSKLNSVSKNELIERFEQKIKDFESFSSQVQLRIIKCLDIINNESIKEEAKKIYLTSSDSEIKQLIEKIFHKHSWILMPQ